MKRTERIRDQAIHGKEKEDDHPMLKETEEHN
jgi:hypothetical protein